MCCRSCGTPENLTKHHLISKSKIRMLAAEGKPIPPDNRTIDICEREHRLIHHGKSKKSKKKYMLGLVFHKEGRRVRTRIRENLTETEIAYIKKYAGSAYLKRNYPAGPIPE